MDSASFYTFLDTPDTGTQKTIHSILINFPSAKDHKLSEQKGLVERQVKGLIETFKLLQ